MRNISKSNLLHVCLSDNPACGVRQHTEILNFGCVNFGAASKQVMHFPFRRSSFLGRVSGYIEMAYHIIFKKSWLVLHEYVRLTSAKRIFLSLLALIAQRVFVLNSRTYWALSDLGIQSSICPSFSPKFNISSPSKGVVYENSIQFLGIQDVNRCKSFLPFAKSLISKFRLEGRSLFVADSGFFKLMNKVRGIQCSDFPALKDLSGANNFLVLFTFPGVDENRSMAIALFEAEIDGIVVCSEIIPNLFGCLSDINLVVDVEDSKANIGIYLGVTNRVYPLSADQMQLYSVAIKKEAVEAFFSIKNAELYWSRFSRTF